MAIRATFTADISQFEAAVRQAQSSLGEMRLRTDDVGKSLQRMAQQFDGSKIIREAELAAAAVQHIGGTTKLTEAEQRKLNATVTEAIAKYDALGKQAPADLRRLADETSKAATQAQAAAKQSGVWGTALGSVKTMAAGLVAGFTLDRVVSGIGRAVASTIEWGGAITDLSAKTGVSMGALQRWEYAAKQSGNTLEQVVTASLQLSKRIEEGDKDVAKAIAGLGLSVTTLQRLQPEAQFNAVADALAKTSDQGQRASAAMALFGRSGADLLPTLTADMKALGDEAERLGVIVDDQTLKAMDDLGDSWQKMKDAGRGLLAEVLSPMVPEMNRLAGAAANAAKAFREDFLGALFKVNEAARGGMFFGARFGQQFAGTTAASPTTRLSVAGVSTAEFFGSQNGLAGEDVVAGVFMRDLVPASRENAKAAREAASALREVAQASLVMRDVNIMNGSRNGGVSLFQTLTNQRTLAELTRESVVLGGQANPWGGVGMLAPAGGGGNYSSLLAPGLNWQGAGVAGLNAAMPFLAQLVTGGDRNAQIGGSVGGAVGGGLGSLFQGAEGFLGKIAGFLGPIGSILGGLIGKLFGPSRGAILGKEADARIGQTQAGLLQQFGSVENIAGMGPAGAALAAAWGSKNVAGEEWFNKLTKALQEQLSLEQQIATAEEQRLALVESLVPTYDQVVEAAGRYGISVEGLGKQVEQLGATETFTQMLEDIQLLARAGGDMGGILSGMADEISELVRRSLAMGTTVPENMRPYIEELMRAGLLLDAQGQALTDISGLNWGAAVATQADKVNEAIGKLDETLAKLIDSLDGLIDRLAHGLPDAAASGARGTTDALSGIEGPDMRGGAVEGFASGSGGIRDFGSGTLAVLHGREAVLTERQLRGLTSRQPTVIRTTVVLDGRVLAESTSAYQAAAAGLVR